MANRPASAGSGGAGTDGAGTGGAGTGGAGTDGLRPGSVSPGSVRPGSVRPGSVSSGGGLAAMGEVAPPLDAVGHRTARRLQAKTREDGVLAWVPYLIVLAGAAMGMVLAWRGARYTAWGTGLIGCSLIVAALFRLSLPTRYAGLLASRRKASDVLTFAVFGIAVLVVALTLP